MPRKKKTTTEPQAESKRSVKEIERDIIAAVREFASHKIQSAFTIMQLGKELLDAEIEPSDF